MTHRESNEYRKSGQYINIEQFNRDIEWNNNYWIIGIWFKLPDRKYQYVFCDNN